MSVFKRITLVLVRLLAGIALVPFCAVFTMTLVSLVASAGGSSDAIMAPPGLALAGGYALWLLLYFVVPRPVRTYVLAHELTHALWGALMGARVSKIKVSKDSGSVTLSKTNFLITLAPYFFPLYTVITVVCYYALSMFMEMGGYYLLWMFLVGFTWGFHFTFTVSTLCQHQSDIRETGYIFSYALIYLLNVAGICLWVVMVSSATLEDLAGLVQDKTALVLGAVYGWIDWGLRTGHNKTGRGCVSFQGGRVCM